MKKIIAILFFISQIWKVQSQEAIPLQHDYIKVIDQWNIKNNSNPASFLKPYYKNTQDTINPVDSLLCFNTYKPDSKKSLFLRKWSYEPLIKIQEQGFNLNIDPLFDFGLAKDFSDHVNYFTNSRGIRLSGNVNNELFFESSFIETQASFPLYMTDFIHTSSVTPGQGQARRYEEGFDYSIASGSLSFKIKKRLLVALGQGKFFAGEGYRSLLLSDNSFNYPYLRFTYDYKKISYTKVFAVLMGDSIPSGSFEVRKKQLASFNILTYTPFQPLQLSLFEGTIWNYPNDQKGLEMDYNYFNPLIAFNSLIYKKNLTSQLGLNVKINLFRHVVIYGQWALDYSKKNKAKLSEKSGIQAGFKCYNLGIKNLFFQTEFNYGAKNLDNLSNNYIPYANYNQALGHIYGNNFTEYYAGLKYTWKRWQANASYLKSQYGRNEYLKPSKLAPFAKKFIYATPFLGMGEETQTENLKASIIYLLNPYSRRSIEIGIESRNANLAGESFKNQMVYFTFKTSISQFYYDF